MVSMSYLGASPPNQGIQSYVLFGDPEIQRSEILRSQKLPHAVVSEEVAFTLLTQWLGFESRLCQDFSLLLSSLTVKIEIEPI